MANRLRLSPELRRLVEHARAGAREAGELLQAPASPPQSPLSPEVRAVLAEWKASGDFDQALAEVIADDPDLSTR
ncbi:MAG: hypothetical protein ACR2LE_00420 [Nocardioidaceae bacterium]